MAVRRFLRSIFKRASASKYFTTSTSTTVISISSQDNTSAPDATSSTAPSTAPSTPPDFPPSSTTKMVLAILANSPFEEAIATLNFVKRVPLEELRLIGSGFSDFGNVSGEIRPPYSSYTSGFAEEESYIQPINTGSSFLYGGVFALPHTQSLNAKNVHDDNNGTNTTSLGNYNLSPLPFPKDVESETITLSSTQSAIAGEGHIPFTGPRPRKYLGRHRRADATQPTYIPAPTPTSTSIFLSERLEEIHQLAWLSANIEIVKQANILDIQDQMFCTDARHTGCSCKRWKLGNCPFYARDLTDKETRVITRAAILVDICLYVSLERVTVEDFLLFKDQLIPEIEGVPTLTHEVFQLLASKYLCRGVFNAEQKQMLIKLQPCFDDDYVEMDDDPKPTSHIKGLEFMTDDEFAELPEYWEVADVRQYNSRFERPHMNMFRASEYGWIKTWGTSVDGDTLHELCMPSIEEPGVWNQQLDPRNGKVGQKQAMADEDYSDADEIF